MSLSPSATANTVQLTDGKSVEIELKPGQTFFFDPVEHTTEIIGTNEAHIVLIELK